MRLTAWLPFLAGSSWRCIGRALLSVPLTVAALVRRGRPTWRRVAAVPLSLVATAVAGYVLAGLALNLAYPARYDSFPDNLTRLTESDPDLSTAWGGPTMAGAWAFHALVGLLIFGIGGIWLVRGLMNLQARLMAS